MQFHEPFMKRAIELSRKGSIIEKTGGPFGAVIVLNRKIISEGYNQVITQCDPTWHAEMQAIREASKKLETPHLTGCILYTSSESCPMCLAAAYWAHIDMIYYASTTKDALEYGNFQDIQILDEIRKEPQERTILCKPLLRSDALEVWKEFSKTASRAHY